LLNCGAGRSGCKFVCLTFRNPACRQSGAFWSAEMTGESIHFFYSRSPLLSQISLWTLHGQEWQSAFQSFLSNHPFIRLFLREGLVSVKFLLQLDNDRLHVAQWTYLEIPLHHNRIILAVRTMTQTDVNPVCRASCRAALTPEQKYATLKVIASKEACAKT
jgi:hypothetical protein